MCLICLEYAKGFTYLKLGCTPIIRGMSAGISVVAVIIDILQRIDDGDKRWRSIPRRQWRRVPNMYSITNLSQPVIILSFSTNVIFTLLVTRYLSRGDISLQNIKCGCQYSPYVRQETVAASLLMSTIIPYLCPLGWRGNILVYRKKFRYAITQFS